MGIFDKNHQGAVQRAHLSDAFGALRSDGGGPRQAPAALQALQQHQARQRAQEAMRAAQDGGGLPLGFNSPAFQAFAQENPEQALQLMAKQAITPESQPDPFRGMKVVGDSVVRVTPDGRVESVYDAPRDNAPKARSALAKLAMDYRDGLIDRATYEAGVRKATASEGLEMVSDGAGGFTFRQGEGVGVGNAPTAIKTEAIKGRNAYDSIMTGLDDFEELVQSGGGAVLPGVRKDAMDETRRALQLQMKELFNLGVLNGPDLALMDQLLVDPTDLLNNAMDMTGIASIEERNKANVARLRKMMTDLIEPKLRSAGQPSARGGASPRLSDMSEADLDAAIARERARQ